MTDIDIEVLRRLLTEIEDVAANRAEHPAQVRLYAVRELARVALGELIQPELTWVCGGSPEEPGWYPVQRGCYDDDFGAPDYYGGSAYWTGKKWMASKDGTKEDTTVVCFSTFRCQNEQHAYRLALRSLSP